MKSLLATTLTLVLALAACDAGVPDTAPTAAPRLTPPPLADFTVVSRELLNMGSRAATARYTVVLNGRETFVDIALVLRPECLEISLGTVLPPNCR